MVPLTASFTSERVSFWPERPIPKVWPRDFYPAGWSIDNLLRYAPTKGARALFQRGVLASKKHFPSVARDPSSLRPLELITIDDFELDSLCVFPGDARHKPQIGRMAGLLAIDVATRRKLHWGLGQRMEREERQPDGTVSTVRTGSPTRTVATPSVARLVAASGSYATARGTIRCSHGGQDSGRATPKAGR